MANFATIAHPNEERLVDFSESPSLVQPQFAKDCDINVALARIAAGDTSMLKQTGMFYDASNAPADLQALLHSVISAQESWESLPDAVRSRFANPQSMMDFLADDKNRDEAVRLGLVVQQAPVEPVLVRVENSNPVPSPAPQAN